MFVSFNLFLFNFFSKMGKKSKAKLGNSTINTKATKRKTSNENNSSSKRQKQGEYPGKYVLLKPPCNDENLETSSEAANSSEESLKVEDVTALNASKQSSTKLSNGQSNGNPKKVIHDLQLEHINNDYSNDQDDEDWSEDSDELDDHDSMTEEDDFDSMSDDGDSDQWSTDTDYSDGDEDDDNYSFHGSDCESVSDDENWQHGSSNDSDYVPDIEDKYIQRGCAILHEAKGLDLAFGDSLESQIIDINDINPALTGELEDEEIPKLVNLDGEVVVDKEEFSMPTPCARTSENEKIYKCSGMSEICKFYDCIDDSGVIVKLRNTIYFHGVLVIRAVANSVQVNGYVLKPKETITVASIARGEYFLNLTPFVYAQRPEVSLLDELKGLLSDHDASNILKEFDPSTEAIIHLQQGLPDSALQMLQFYSPIALLPTKKMLLADSPCPSSELILSAKFFTASDNTFILNEQWDNIEVKEDSRFVIIGGKNVGKSALTQFLINKNVAIFEKILLIDLDIGQPIIGAAQTISATVLKKPIIGPGYLNGVQPDKCLLYGDKSIMISPFKYVDCVRQLLQFCFENESYRNIPWLINTMGYQKGFGLQLMCILLRILQPTELVQVQHANNSFNFSKIVTESIVNQFELSFFDPEDIVGIEPKAFFTTHTVDSVVNRDSDVNSKWISNATEKRKLSMIAQLAKLVKGNGSCLNDVTPFVAPIDAIQLVVMDEEYVQLELASNKDVLNGNLVYLCHSEDQTSLSSTSILDCLGVGIVRGIDSINRQLYLLLPQNDCIDKLQSQINVLAIGNIPLPAEIVLKQSYNINGNIPHVTCFKDRNVTSKRYINKRNIKDCF